MSSGDNQGSIGGAAKILLAARDASPLTILRQTLEKWGYEVHTAPDGEAALATALEHNVRLLICDEELPGTGAAELCKRIRQTGRRPYTYIMLLTAAADARATTSGLDAGADDFLPRPFDGTVLRARLAVGQRVLAQEDRLQTQHGELQELKRRLASMTYLDPLMSVGNRQAFHAAIEAIHHNALAHGAAYGLILADVDSFKLFNEVMGHGEGDRALAQVAKVVSATLRGGDRLFRYGGEELVVVTRTRATAEVTRTAERLRLAVEGLGLVHPRSVHGRITCSFGGIQVGTGGVEPGLTWAEIVERADEMLNMAKEQGRNCVMIWDESREQAA